MRDFGSNYYKIRHTKDCGNEPVANNKFSRQQENSAIVQHAFDEIILQEKNKLSAEDESQENIDSEIDDNDLYDIDNMILDEKKEWRKCAFERKLKNIYDIKIHNVMTCMHKN